MDWKRGIKTNSRIKPIQLKIFLKNRNFYLEFSSKKRNSFRFSRCLNNIWKNENERISSSSSSF